MNIPSHQFFIPWQRRKDLGFIKSFFSTVRLILLNPNHFFSHLIIEKSIREPFIFYFVSSLLGILLKFSLMSFINNRRLPPLPFPIIILAALIMIILLLFIFSSLGHIFTIPFKSSGGWLGTFNIFCYCGTANLLGVIPILGPILNLLFSAVICVIGIKHVHKMSWLKAHICFVFLLIAAISIPGICLVAFKRLL